MSQNPKPKSKEDRSMQRDLQNLKEAVEREKQTSSGEFVSLKDVNEGDLICFKKKTGDIMCGFAIECNTACVTVVLKKRKMRTTLANKTVWLVKGLPNSRTNIEDTFEDKEFDHEAFKTSTGNVGEPIGQDKIKFGTGIYFTKKKADKVYCGYAYKNGSNCRVVCKERATQLVTSKTVWKSDNVTTDKRYLDLFVNADFTKYNEDEIILEVKDYFDCEEILDKIDEMQIRHADKKT